MNSTIIGQFPSLSNVYNGKRGIFLDGPAGVQVPSSVIEAISDYYKHSNANTHGAFATTQQTDVIMQDTREACASFLHAESYKCISFGQNMTSLNYSLSRAIGRQLNKGDEILITQLDHESNRGPWLRLQDKGIIVKEIGIHSNGTINYDDLTEKISAKTKLLCMGMASNYTGAVNDVAFARKLTQEHGAQLLLDAVHYAPHFSIDVQKMDCDFLLCSAYKFYGPHVGILYAKQGHLDSLDTDFLRTADSNSPYRIETGTLNHAAIAGVKASIEFVASMGSGETLRHQLETAYQSIEKHEKELAIKLYSYLISSTNYAVVGPDFSTKRAPTLSFLSENNKSLHLCKKLAAENVFAWDGHFYALRASEVLGNEEKGGVTRMGISVYTTDSDVEETITLLKELAN
jgi:cysteine desulfurase family protein (TIGR01976 family)